MNLKGDKYYNVIEAVKRFYEALMWMEIYIRKISPNNERKMYFNNI